MTRPAAGDEAGFTLVELSITMMLAAIISVSILGVLFSQTNVEKRMQRLSDDQIALRDALIEIGRDVRSADPLLSLPDITAYKTQIRVTIKDVGSDTTRNVQWRLDTATATLVREELDGSGNVTGTSYRVAGVVATQPIFTYYRSIGTAYTLDPLVETPNTVSLCAVKVHVRLEAAPTSGPAPIAVESDIQLRNRVPQYPEHPWCT
ncbi:MAG TPA: type II secretion system protein [Acidimicrobiales bacterium]|nr:type II secretion system protein [Acidimicrobiales bacterium]